MTPGQPSSQAEAAEVIGVSTMTVNRRLHRGIQRLSESLADLYPAEGDETGPDLPDSSDAGGGAG